jgi:glycosyltransferase involved in cell wall biosynthesis
MNKTNKISILYVLPNTKQGGSETQLLYLLRNINKQKFNVFLGLLYQNSQLKEEFNSIRGVQTVDFSKKSKHDISIYFKIAKFLKEKRIDIIQSFLGNHHAYIPGLLAGKGVVICGIRSTHVDNSLLDTIKLFTALRLLTSSKRFILVSNSHAGKDIYLHKGFKSNSIYVIPNGIDYLKYSNGKKGKIIKEFNLRNKLVITNVARLDKRKNHESLIRMFKRVNDDYKSSVLIIVGDGPEMQNLKKLIVSLKLVDKVILPGNRKDIPNFLSASNIFVFPSLFPESWPNAVGEAMSAGLSVIAYPRGDTEYLIKNNVDGIITKEDINEFEIKVRDLIKNKAKRLELGKNAQIKAILNFKLSNMVNLYEELYIKKVSELER